MAGVAVIIIIGVIALIATGLTVAAYLCRATQTPTIEALRRAGRALGGTVTRAPDGTFQLDALVAGQSVHLGYQMAFACGFKPEFFAEVALTDHMTELDVHPRTESPHPTHAVGLEEITSGDDVFDAQYHVLSSAEQQVLRLLPPEARRLMVETGPVVIRVSEGRLEVRRTDPMVDAPTILNLARIAGLSARAYA